MQSIIREEAKRTPTKPGLYHVEEVRMDSPTFGFLNAVERISGYMKVRASS